jgi:hypothetical protein
MGTGVDERTGEVMLDVHARGEDAQRARAAKADPRTPARATPVQLRILDAP